MNYCIYVSKEEVSLVTAASYLQLIYFEMGCVVLVACDILMQHKKKPTHHTGVHIPSPPEK